MTGTEPRYRVSEERLAAFESDGAVHLPSVADAGWATRLRAAIDRTAVDPATGVARAYFDRVRVWESDPDCRGFCFESPIAEIAAQLMRADKVNMLYDQVFVKEPGTAAPTPWHNDLPYWPIRGTEVVTLWVALDPVTLETGGLEFIRGSHRSGKRYRPFNADGAGGVASHFAGDRADDYDDLPDFEAARAGLDIVSWDLEAGDAIAFHALTVHGARGNRHPARRRRGYAIRMTGPGVRYHAGRAQNQFIVNPGLKTGDPLDSLQYPVLYPAAARA